MKYKKWCSFENSSFDIEGIVRLLVYVSIGNIFLCCIRKLSTITPIIETKTLIRPYMDNYRLKLEIYLETKENST